MVRKLLFLQIVSVLFLQFTLRVFSATCSDSKKPSNSNKDLGIEDGSIPDQNIRATSYSGSNHQPWRARIKQEASGQKGAAWCAQKSSTSEYLEVNLVFPSKITYVAMQGKNESINGTYFDVSGVSSLSISYSVDNQTFEDYVYNGEKYTFNKEPDNTKVFYCSLPYPIVAQFVRFHPITWDSSICLKVGLYGMFNVSTEKVDVTKTVIGSSDTWWWILFWVVLGTLIITAFVFCAIYSCCLKRREHFSSKSIHRRRSKAMHSKRSHRGIPLVERSSETNSSRHWEIYNPTVINNEIKHDNPDEEVQEVTADFTMDDVISKKGVVGFSVEEEEDGDKKKTPIQQYDNLTSSGIRNNQLSHDYEEISLGDLKNS